MVSWLTFDTVFMIVFATILTLILLYEKRRGEKLEVQKLVGYLLYAILYRTTWGLDAMGRIAKRWKGFLRFNIPLMILFGIGGMLFITGYLVYAFIDSLLSPTAIPSVQLVLPIQSAVTFYVPALYWILSLVLIASVHEMAHGVVARYFGIKIKSSGFAFLAVIVPIVPAAFVEPDEKDMAKRSAKEQLAVFAAGPYSNFLFGLVCILLLMLAAPFATHLVSTAYGVSADAIPDMPLAIAGYDGTPITDIEGTPIRSQMDVITTLSGYAPGDTITLTTASASQYPITLIENPQDPSRGFAGITNLSIAYTGAMSGASSIVQGFVYFSSSMHQLYAIDTIPSWIEPSIVWVLGLIGFLFLLNFGLGFANLLPIFIADGGRILFVTIHKVFNVPEEPALKATMLISTGTFIVLLASLFLPMLL